MIGALVALKSNLGLWPVFLFFCGLRRTAIYAAVSCAVSSTLPVLLYGPAVYLEWLRAFPRDLHYMAPLNVSLIALARWIGHPDFGRGAALGVIAVSLAVVVRRKPGVRVASGLALTLAILASPIGWFYYSLFLAPVLLSFRWDWKLTSILAATMLPPVLLAYAHLSPLLISCFYLVPLLLLWAYFLCSAAPSVSPQTHTQPTLSCSEPVISNT